MREVSVVRADSGVVLGSRVAVAESFRDRLRGLVGRPPLEEGEGLLIPKCASVHTFGMDHPIDVVFLDAEGRVVRSIARLGPLRLGLGGTAAFHALELPAGRLDETGTAPGVRLSWS